MAAERDQVLDTLRRAGIGTLLVTAGLIPISVIYLVVEGVAGVPSMLVGGLFTAIYKYRVPGTPGRAALMIGMPRDRIPEEAALRQVVAEYRRPELALLACLPFFITLFIHLAMSFSELSIVPDVLYHVPGFVFGYLHVIGVGQGVECLQVRSTLQRLRSHDLR